MNPAIEDAILDASISVSETVGSDYITYICVVDKSTQDLKVFSPEQPRTVDMMLSANRNKRINTGKVTLHSPELF